MSTRSDALEWWKFMDFQHRVRKAKEWQDSLPSNSFRKSWSFEMIDASSSTIEMMYFFTKNTDQNIEQEKT